MSFSDPNSMTLTSSSSCTSTEDYYITYLPDDILLTIFQLLTGKSLIVCKRVCNTWKNLVEYLEQKPAFHYDLCIKEIPPWVLFDILDKLFPDHWQNKRSVDWKKVYYCWCQWDINYRSRFSVKPFVSELDGVTSIQVSGEWLLISTYRQVGQLIAVSLRDGKKLVIYSGSNKVLSFELVHCDVNRNSNNTYQGALDLERFFDTISHNEIWLEYDKCYIQLGRHYARTVDKLWQTIRHSYGYRLKITNRQVLYLQKVSYKVNGPLVIEKEMPIANNGSVNFWAKKIAHYNSSVSQVAIELFNVNMTSQDITNEISHTYTYPPSSYFHTYSWQNTFFFTYTDAHILIFHDKNGCKVHSTPYTKGYITATLFYCNHILMGTNRGLLMIYKVDKPEDCGNIQPFETESCNIQISNERIIRITIAEPINHQGEKPMIICATSSKVYTVSVL